MSEFAPLDSTPVDPDDIHRMIGVHWLEPLGAPEYQIRDGRVWITVGQITYWPQTGVVRVRPREGVADRPLRVLRGEAVAVAMGQSVPSKARAWRYFNRKKPCWSAWIAVGLPDDHADARAVKGAAEWVTEHEPLALTA